MATKKRAMTDEQIFWKNHLPESYKTNYEKAVTTNSLKEAIKAKCLDCMNWSKGEITVCPVPWCPLFYHRPYQKSQKPPKE